MPPRPKRANDKPEIESGRATNAELLSQVNELKAALKTEKYEHSHTLQQRDSIHADYLKARVQVDQLEVQLAACSVIAKGRTGNEHNCPGPEAWGPACEDVKALRAEFERLRG